MWTPEEDAKLVVIMLDEGKQGTNRAFLEFHGKKKGFNRRQKFLREYYGSQLGHAEMRRRFPYDDLSYTSM